MDEVKLEDFKCGNCEKIPKPGDKIYICSACTPREYRCQNCYEKYPSAYFHDFCLKIVNEKMDEIAKDKKAAVESGVEDSDG